jgi:hypothetical protein
MSFFLKKALLFILFISSVSFAQLNPKLPPSGNFDLRGWKLQTLDTNYRFTEVKPSKLSDGYTSNLFYTDSLDGALVFKTPENGTTTKDAVHPRVELRQVSGSADWPLSDTTEHTLTAECKVISVVQDTPKVIIGQIHGGDKKSQIFKMLWNGKKDGKCKITAQFKSNDEDKGDHNVDIVKGLSLGDVVTYKITMKAGTITVTVNGNTCSQTYTAEFFGTTDKYYFKAGNYLQCSGPDANKFGVVKFYKLALQ